MKKTWILGIFTLVMMCGCNTTTQDDVITSTNGLVKITHNMVSITKSGNYVLTGEINNTQIVINIDKEDEVTLVLNNLNIKSTNGPVILGTHKNKN